VENPHGDGILIRKGVSCKTRKRKGLAGDRDYNVTLVLKMEPV